MNINSGIGKYIFRTRKAIGRVVKYTKLRILFSKKSEFGVIHPNELKLWERKFRQMIKYDSERIFPIAEEFLTVKIEKVKDQEIQGHGRAILICALKDEKNKIEQFMEHYRKLGVDRFVILDNLSTDGTFEYLKEQKDVELYRCEHLFTANRKIAWMNRLIAEHGIGKWYLMVDSDEFITYFGASQHGLEDVVDKCEEKGYKRLGGAMIDMYPDSGLFQTGNKKNFRETYCYFDRDTYTVSTTWRGLVIIGGPRRRVFGTKMKVSKYCLFYFEEDDVVSSAHYEIPYKKGFNVPTALAALHYKFVNESDYQKMLEAVETGMHSDNSAEYKTYYNAYKENRDVTFYDEAHSEFFSEDAMHKLGFFETIFE